MSRETYTPSFRIYVDKVDGRDVPAGSDPENDKYYAECMELNLHVWGRNAIHAEERLQELIRDRLIEVLRKDD